MKGFNIYLTGVGGQGILSIAFVIDHAAMDAGFHFKQAEVHGMSQRGGAVMAQAYRWVDEDGVVHFSDVPTEGAERIELPHSDRPRSTAPAP